MDNYFSVKDEALLTPPNDRAAYSGRTAWVMAQCSALAYVQDDAQLREFLKQGNFDLTARFGDTLGISGYVAVSNKHPMAVLVFKGTVPDQEATVKADLKFWFYKSEGVNFHAGFYTSYKSLEDKITPILANIGKDKPIYVTGHSLGGALASIAAMKSLDSDKMAACYTFGAPRVCSVEGLLNYYKVPIYRVAHCADIVPCLPLFAQGYVQLGDFRYINDKNELAIGSAAVFIRIGYQIRAFCLWHISRFIKDHAIDRYSVILKRIAKQREDSDIRALKKLEII